MTATEAPAGVFTRLAGLDDQTLALVTSVFGRTPAVGLDETETARLDGVITAVLAGRQTAGTGTPITPAEAAAPVLPPLPPADTSLIRHRIRAMDPAAQQLFITRWQASGLPVHLKDEESGASIPLPVEQHNAIEQLVADHEPPAPEGAHAALMERWQGLAPGPRCSVDARLSQQSARSFRDGINCTTGRAWQFACIIDQVEAEAEAVVAAAIGPVADPVGQVVATPVADADALANALPDKATVAETLAWMGADLERARHAHGREVARKRPRDGVLSKLAPLVGGLPTPPPAGETAGEGAGVPPAALPSPVLPAESVVPVPGQIVSDVLAGDDGHLESTLFRSTPVNEWGPLKRVAYLRRLSAELAVAGSILETEAKA